MLEGLVQDPRKKTIWWQIVRLSQATLIHGKFHIIIWYQLKKTSYISTLSYNIDIHWSISLIIDTSHDATAKPRLLVHRDAQLMRLPKQRQGAPPRLWQGCCCSGSASSRTVMTLSLNHQPRNPTKKLLQFFCQVIFDVVFFQFFCLHHFVWCTWIIASAMGDEMIFSSKFCVDTCNLAEFSGLFCFCFCDGDDVQLARGENRILFHRIISDMFIHILYSQSQLGIFKVDFWILSRKFYHR